MPTPPRPIEFAGPGGRALLRATVRPVFLTFVCATGLLASDQASARDSTARDYAPRDVGGWTVAESKDGKGCFLTRDYDRAGGTTLLFGLDIDGTNRLSVLNANWSIKPKDRLKLNFRLSNSSYPAHFAIGMVSQGKQGFVTSFGTKFPSYFASSKALGISRGEVPVERLSLDGGEAAIAELRHCVADRRASSGAAADETTGLDPIPTDPFGHVAKPKSKISDMPPKPKSKR